MYSVIIDHLSEEQARELSEVLEGYIASCNRLLHGASISVQQCDADREDREDVEWPLDPASFSSIQSDMNKDLVLEYFDRYNNEDIEMLNTKATLVDMFYTIYKSPPLSSATKADIVFDIRRFYNQCERIRGFKLLGSI